MDSSFGWNPATLGAITSGATLLVLVAAAIFARQQVLEAKVLREEQTRPFVVVDFDLDTVPFSIELVIQNVGRTVARNVRLEFDPEPQSTFGSDELSLANSNLLKNGIPTLPPNKRIATMFDATIQRFGSDLPMTYVVKVSYEDHRGRRFKSEEHTLDLGFYRNLTARSDKTIHDVANSLEKIQKEMKKWTSGIRGIEVYTRDKAAHNRSTRRWMRLRQPSDDDKRVRRLLNSVIEKKNVTLDRFGL